MILEPNKTAPIGLGLTHSIPSIGVVPNIIATKIEYHTQGDHIKVFMSFGPQTQGTNLSDHIAGLHGEVFYDDECQDFVGDMSNVKVTQGDIVEAWGGWEIPLERIDVTKPFVVSFTTRL